MLSTPWIKSRLVALLAVRSELDGVQVLLGPARDRSELYGERADVKAMVYFGDAVEGGIDGDFVRDESCGDAHKGMMEEYDLPIFVSVGALDTDIGYAEADQFRAQALAAVAGVVADDYRLGMSSNADPLGYVTDCYVQPVGTGSTISRFKESAGTAPLTFAEGRIVLRVQAWLETTAT